MKPSDPLNPAPLPRASRPRRLDERAPKQVAARAAVSALLTLPDPPLSEGALEQTLWPPLNTLSIRRLIRTFRKRPPARASARLFGSPRPEEAAWAQYGLRAAAQALGVWRMDRFRIRELVFSLAEEDRREVDAIVDHAVARLLALGEQASDGPWLVLQLQAVLTPVSRAWEPGALPGRSPELSPPGSGPLAADPEAEPQPLQFDDPLHFLRTWLDWVQAHRASAAWTVSQIARRAGVSPAHLTNLRLGNRPLTVSMAERLVAGLRLQGEQREGWILMVRRHLSGSVTERALLTQKLVRLEAYRRSRSVAHLAGVALQHLPCGVLHSLTISPGAPRPLAALSELLRPSLTEAQVRDAAAQLEESGLMRRSGDGTVVPYEAPYIGVGGRYPADLKRAFLREALVWADRRLLGDPQVGWGLGLTLLPEAALPEAVEVFEGLVAALLALALRADQQPRPGPRRLYLLHVGLVPCSRPVPDLAR